MKERESWASTDGNADIAMVSGREIAVAGWAMLRQAMWPSASAEMHRQEVAATIQGTSRKIAFVAQSPSGDGEKASKWVCSTGGELSVG